MTTDLAYKVVLLGDQYVGKSSIMLRHVHGRFTPNYVQTYGTEFDKWRTNVDGVSVLLRIYDSMGQADMRTVVRSVYRDAHGILLTCPERPEMILVGNKADLDENHDSTNLKSAKQTAESLGLELVTVSAKTGENLDHVFSLISQKLVKNTPKSRDSTGHTTLDIRHWAYDTGHTTLGIRHWTYDIGYTTLGIRHWAYDTGIRHWIYDTGYTTLDIRQ
ncbi:YPT1-like protein [Mya arenaria]|uniref:YPT1-like protein n=1 Tax=Mya arenaria TaxID=6604 RepID=A0ABY7FV26_MYAAR|nr:YPT1-like protein [Mya arenaria]